MYTFYDTDTAGTLSWIQFEPPVSSVGKWASLLRRCVHANLAVCLDRFGTGCLRTTKMYQFVPIFYIELGASRTFYGTRPREIASTLGGFHRRFGKPVAQCKR